MKKSEQIFASCSFFHGLAILGDYQYPMLASCGCEMSLIYAQFAVDNLNMDLVRYVSLLCLVCLSVFTASTSCASGPQRLSTATPHSRSLEPKDGRNIVEIAEKYLGIPYKYGGTSPSGFDCSGFVRYVYAKAGYKLPRDAREQFSTLKPQKVPSPGDLVFFRTNGSSISHVGIYVGNLRFIHSPRTGKTVSFADLNNRYWKKRYAGSRTIFW